jgi:cytochrome b561
MIQNMLELWYWIIVLAIMVGIVIYFVIGYVRDSWRILKNRLDDEQPTVFAERITEPYSKRMVVIHWLTLALLVIAWYLGDTLVDERNERSATLAGYLVHALVGGSVLMVTAMRMIYRSVDRMPQLASNSLMNMMAIGIQHWLYLLLVLIPLTGFMTLLTSRVGEALVTVNAKLLPEKFTGPSVISNVSHDLLMTVLMVVVAIHVLGAAWHQFIMKDGLMRRMSLRRKDR